jgi:hypothetical protein
MGAWPTLVTRNEGLFFFRVQSQKSVISLERKTEGRLHFKHGVAFDIWPSVLGLDLDLDIDVIGRTDARLLCFFLSRRRG